jgi:hypothetical protein
MIRNKFRPASTRQSRNAAFDLLDGSHNPHRASALDTIEAQVKNDARNL